METKKLSFMLPCYGSEKTVAFVIDEIREVVGQRSGYELEIVAVNDCSPDGVWGVLTSIAAEDERVKLISLAKNMNRPGAVMAGLRYSSGDYVVVMDDDGQCPMDRFWELLAPVEADYDVAMAGYPARVQSKFKDFGTFVNRKMTEYLLDRPKELEFTNFMVMSRYVVDEICRYQNPYPYMTGLVLRTTSRIVNVPMEERDRYCGKTTFRFSKLVSLWMNGLTAFSVKPLRAASFLGFLCAFSGFLYALYLIVRRIVLPNISAGYSSIMASILIIGGVLMLLLGIIGEYVGRIYISLNRSPQFVVRDTVNIRPEDRIRP